jgi:hypothetical protein
MTTNILSKPVLSATEDLVSSIMRVRRLVEKEKGNTTSKSNSFRLEQVNSDPSESTEYLKNYQIPVRVLVL